VQAALLAAHLAVLNGASWDLLNLGIVLDVHLTLPSTHVTRHSLHGIQCQLLHMHIQAYWFGYSY
jgi:hypothetical protein